jgi:hypothetical protein
VYRPDDKQGRVLGSGTFALQAHDPGSVVRYRNMKVKMLPDDAQPPAGLVPLADAELDRLVTQASNDNVPLVDVGVTAHDSESAEFASFVRRVGLTPINDFRPEAMKVHPPAVVLVFDGDGAPDVTASLKAAKAAGLKVVFRSDDPLDEAQLKRRLQAIRDAGLGWKDFYVPGRP